MNKSIHEELSLEECNPEDIPLPGEEPPAKRRRTVLPPFHELRGSSRRGNSNRVEVVTIEDETRHRNLVSWAERISNVRKILTGIFQIKKYRCADRTRVTSIQCKADYLTPRDPLSLSISDDQKMHYVNVDVVKEAKVHRIIGTNMPPNWELEIRNYGLKWDN